MSRGGVLDQFFPAGDISEEAGRTGFRIGAKGTHSSRTIMLADLSTVLAAVPPLALRQDYAAAIVHANCLGKPTASTRELANQRLGELYALDPSAAVFRVFRRLWDLGQLGRPLLAMLCALARDPLLRATAPAVLCLAPAAEVMRDRLKKAVRDASGDRLNDAVLDKVCRNAASSWEQSGHLQGRTFKRRRPVQATPQSLAYALFLGRAAGFRGAELLGTGWIAVLDCSPSLARQLAVDAKRLGLIDVRMAGEVVDIDLGRLDRVGARA